MKTAVFLGAGASKVFGYPLTNELLPRILAALDHDTLFRGINSEQLNAADRSWFRDGLYRFFPGLESAKQLATPEQPLAVGVTDLLTLIDRALLVGEARAGMPPEELGRFRHLVERAIYEVLLHDNDRRKAPNLAALQRFVQWLTLQDAPVSLITTNYDTAVDQRIFEAVGRTDRRKWEARIGAEVDVGFAWRSVDDGLLVPRPAQPRWQILKLHGSVNWLRCSLCGQIYQNVGGPVGSKAFEHRLSDWNTCHCNAWARLRLHLVTPSFVRQTNDAHLLGIWQSALETLRTADRWVIVGYSLPPDDISIRSLLMRAWDGHANPRKPQVLVVQRKNTWTQSTYQAFFPPANLVYHDGGLDEFLNSPP